MRRWWVVVSGPTVDNGRMQSPPGLGDIRKICILGWGLKGDLFIRIPIIEALKERFPQARITVVADPGNVIVLENHPDVDQIFAFGRKKTPIYRYVVNTISNTLALRRQHFDLSVNLSPMSCDMAPSQ